VPWIVLTPRMSTSRIGRSHTSLWLGSKHRRKERNSADATTVQNIPDAPDISLNDVSFHFHDCAHGDGLRRQECYSFDALRTTVPVRMLPTYITDWTKLQHILSMAGQKHGRKGTRRMPVQPPYRISRFSRYFAQRRVLHSMTVHMETVTPPTRMSRV
jgi:hypothetical protein